MVHIKSAVADMLKIEHPVLLAGMGNCATKALCAAVSNAGGIGVLGGVTFPSPEHLRVELEELKAELKDKGAFGVDLLLPQLGRRSAGGKGAMNSDYTGGKLPELIDIICESGARLFVSAVGVPPKWAVDKLHKAGILVMNMVGHPKHVDKALAVGVDLICAQGHEAGGHSGEVATMVLIPQCVDRCAGKISPLTGGPVHVVAAGGIYDGRTMAAALALGAEAVWVGTRFVASVEATGTKQHKQSILKAGPSDTLQTLAATGRPCRMYKSEYYLEWEGARKEEKTRLLDKGLVPLGYDMAKNKVSAVKSQPMFMGQGAGGITSILPAAEILKQMVDGAAAMMGKNAARL